MTAKVASRPVSSYHPGRSMRLLDHIATILKSFDIEPRPLDRIVDAYLRRHRELSSSDRRLISDVAFGVVRWRRRLDGLLFDSITRRPDNRSRAIAYIAWKLPDLANRIDEIDSAEIADIRFDKREKNFPGGDAGWHSLPDYLYRMIVDAYGPSGASEIAECLNEPARVVLRINSLKGSREEIMSKLASEGIESVPTDRSPYGLILEKRVNLDASDCFKAGFVEVQDESSQLAAIIADPKAGETVLDACTGAGGKSLAMAMLMQGRGRIIAADPVASKLKELERRAKRSAAKIIEVISTKDLLNNQKIKGKCDMVFIDAPCTGSGTFRRNPDLKWRLNPDTISVKIELQRNLIREYADWVRHGGRLVYATCSILREENEDIVAALADDVRFRTIDVREILNRQGICTDGIVSDEGYLKVDPRSGSRDGFFAAVFVRT